MNREPERWQSVRAWHGGRLEPATVVWFGRGTAVVRFANGWLLCTFTRELC